MKMTICGLTIFALAATAQAADKAPAAAAPSAPAPGAAQGNMPDMSKMGPMSRPVTKQDKKGIDDTYKAFEDAMMKGDVNAAADLVDFPVIMMSDDSKGAVKSFNASREQWTAIFAPFATNRPKDMKMTNKHTPTFLSDTLAVSIEQTSMSAGKMKGKWNAMAVLAQVDGKWKFKQMAEAGWGDMPAPAAAASAGAPAPTTAKAAAPAAAGSAMAKAPAAAGSAMAKAPAAAAAAPAPAKK
jgi:ketosteroid isomerase-like protein